MAGLVNNLRVLRSEAGLTQQVLAGLAGISRQAYSALESGAANPSTEVALRLARALERDLESVFYLPQEMPGPVQATLVGEAMGQAAVTVGEAKGQTAVSQTPQRTRLYRVGTRTFARPLAGRDSARHAVVAAEGMVVGRARRSRQVSVQPFDHEDLDVPSLALSGCDPAVGLLEGGLRRMGVRLVAAEESSHQALMGLARGEAHVAGCHLLDDETGTYNVAQVQRLVPFPCTLVTFADWQQGLIVAPGNPRGIQGLESLLNPRLAIMNRQPGSGSRALLDRYLEQAGVPTSAVRGYQREESGHLAVAAAVASGRAHAGIGVKAAALAMGLDFVPLEDEHYDLVIPDHFLSEATVQALLDLLRQEGLHRRVESLGGYDVANMGLPTSQN